MEWYGLFRPHEMEEIETLIEEVETRLYNIRQEKIAEEKPYVRYSDC